MSETESPAPKVPDGMHPTPRSGVTGLKLLEGKVAVIYGAGGFIGSAVAKAYAKEGAAVFVTGKALDPLRPVAGEITRDGGFSEAAVVDALDLESVEEHLRGVVKSRGRVDVSFNLISTGVGMGTLLTDLTEAQFARAAFDRPRSNFITATAAARVMQKQKGGVILSLTAPNGRLPVAKTGGFSIGNAAIEAFCRQLALEVGPQGVRVVCLRTGGTPENPVLQWVFQRLAEVRGTTKEAVEQEEAERTALKRSPLVAEVANAAVLMASDYAGAITATTINASCGELVD